ncbi:MAG: hypothetical protein BWY80_01411 [Firmicutes bacterium ADurb.Bin456]|nr:MAG: hypothetical protein BWY80_01411 [Firmicutes bacterium ADurb.Bin456]
MEAGQAQHLSVDVGTQDPDGPVTPGKVRGLLPGPAPEGLGNRRPFFRRKGPPGPGGQVQPQQGGLDGQRAGAAKGIDKRTGRTPAAKQDQRRGGYVVEQGHLNGITGTVFFKPFPPVNLFHLFHNRLFNNGLAVRHTVQLGFDGFSFNGKGGVFRQPVRPGQGFGLLKELLEAAGREFPHLDQHPVRGAQPEIGPADGGLVPGEGDPGVFHHHIPVTKFFHFPRHHSLQAEGCRGD